MRKSAIQALDWRDALAEPGPRYLQIVGFLERAMGDGRLRAGDRLPAQRDLAAALGVDLTTVTRAYAEARQRELLHARGSKGSFVAALRGAATALLDLEMNLPPPPTGVDTRQLLERAFGQVLAHADAHALMSYHPAGGTPGDREAGVRWLERPLGSLSVDRVTITGGAQAALAGLLLALTAPGDVIAAEPLVYPGLIGATRQLGRELFAVASDASGMRPDALEQAVVERGVRVVYLNPTLANPTTATMPDGRRDDIVAMARKHELVIIEDDPYWLLSTHAPLPLAARAPERVYYLSTLSKTLTPGLRLAYVATPDAEARMRLLQSQRAFELMAAPLMTSVATQWIHDGTAQRIVDGVHTEAKERQTIAARALSIPAEASAEGIHLWMRLPRRWTAMSLTMAARVEGLAVAPSNAFSVTGNAPEALRISLGGTSSRTRLAEALGRLAALLHAFPEGEVTSLV